MLHNLGTLETIAIAVILTGGVVSTLLTIVAVARSLDDAAGKPAHRRPSQSDADKP